MEPWRAKLFAEVAPVFCAIRNNDLRKLNELIKEGRRTDLPDEFGCTPLFVAVEKLSRGCVSILLRHPSYPINSQNIVGCTSLYVACNNKLPPRRLIKDLLERGADPNIANDTLSTPLHIACSNANLDVVKLLLMYDADINAQDTDKYTPLHTAVEREQIQIVDYLLKMNADTSLKNCYGYNPLMFAISLRHEKLVDVLLPFTSNLNTTGNHNDTTISLAVKTQNLQLIKKLVEHGASVNYYGSLNLMSSITHIEIFEYLWNKLETQHILSTIRGLLTFVLNIHEHLPQLTTIFQVPSLDFRTAVQHVYSIFDNIFAVNISPNQEYFELNKESLVIVTQGLIRQNVKMGYYGLCTFITFLKACPYRLDLLNIAVHHSEVIVDSCVLIVAFTCHPSFGLYLLQYFTWQETPENIYEKFLSKRKYTKYLQYLFPLFMPKFRITKEMKCDKTVVKTLRLFRGEVKSLQEISRDVARQHIGMKCCVEEKERMKHFSDTVQQLEMPHVIKDIMLYRKPVNYYA